MRTVHEFKQFVLQEAGLSLAGFVGLSAKHRDFICYLNDLGWEKKTVSAEEVGNIDASAPLTDEEWEELEIEFRKLQEM